jgi:hypothetical protein
MIHREFELSTRQGSGENRIRQLMAGRSKFHQFSVPFAFSSHVTSVWCIRRQRWNSVHFQSCSTLSKFKLGGGFSQPSYGLWPPDHTYRRFQDNFHLSVTWYNMASMEPKDRCKFIEHSEKTVQNQYWTGHMAPKDPLRPVSSQAPCSDLQQYLLNLKTRVRHVEQELTNTPRRPMCLKKKWPKWELLNICPCNAATVKIVDFSVENVKSISLLFFICIFRENRCCRFIQYNKHVK